MMSIPGWSLNNMLYPFWNANRNTDSPISFDKNIVFLEKCYATWPKIYFLTHWKKGIMRKKGHYWWQAGVKIYKVAIFSGYRYF